MGFERFVPRAALSWLGDAPLERHRRVGGTLVFADIFGFTALSERLAGLGREGAEELTAHINQVLGGLLDGPLASTGDLLAFGGDAVLLLFSGEAHERRGTAAAHEMRASVRANGVRQTPMGRVRLRISIGVNSGDVDLFLVGDSHRQLLSAGPTVTELLTLESAASAGQIVVGKATSAALPASSVGGSLGPGVLLTRRPSAPRAEGAAPSIVDAESLIPTALRRELADVQDPEHRIISVAFLHARGLDALIATNPDAATDAMHAVVSTAQRRFEEHEVTFLAADVYDDGAKVIGVGGAPRSTGNDEERLLRAVRAVTDDLADGPLAIRGGVHRGTAFVGAVGTPSRAAYTVMGDTVNTAARVMARAGDGELLATHGVLDRSGTAFELTALEPFAAKGKAEPIHASAVGAQIGSKPRAGEAFPLVGRDVERDRLITAWHAARDGKGAAAEIVGGPGLGKSRLVAEVVEAAQRDGATVRRLQCELYEQGTPHFMTRLLLTTAVGSLDAGALRDALDRAAPDLVRWLPLLGTALGVEYEPTRESTDLAEPLRPGRAAQTAAALALGGPGGLLVVEDTHWLDPSSRPVLATIARTISNSNWTLLVTRRPEGEPLVGDDCSIALNPLNDDAITALARQVRGSAGIHPTDAAAIAERAAGNPLYALELVRGLDSGLPESLEAAITATIDRLDPSDRLQLRVLSVLGSRFDLGLARIVSAEVGTGTDFGALADFLQPTQGEVAFRHTLYRDVAYEGLPYRRRRSLHARAAAVIESSAANPEDEAEALSLHFYEAARWEPALRYSTLAAERAAARSASVEQTLFWERASTAATRGGAGERVVSDTSLALAEALSNIANHEKARAAATRLRRSQDRVTAARACLVLADSYGQQGDPRKQLRVATDGLRRLDSADAPRVRGLLLAARLVALASLGRSKEALRQSNELVEVAAANDDAGQLARAYAIRQFIRNRSGIFDDSDGLQAARIYSQLGNRHAEGIAVNNAGSAAMNAGRWTDAANAFDQATTALRAAGVVVPALGPRYNRALILSRQGSWEAAAIELAEVAAEAQSAGEVDFALFAQAELALATARLGNLDRAIELRDKAMAFAADRQAKPGEESPEVELCEILVLARRYDDAIAAAVDTSRDTPLQRTFADLWTGYALAGKGELESAIHHLGRAAAGKTDPDAWFPAALAEHALAHITGGVEHRGEAQRLFDALGIERVIDVPMPATT